MVVSEGDPSKAGVTKDDFKVVRIPVLDMKTGETVELVLKSKEEVEKLLESMRQQDPEWD